MKKGIIVHLLFVALCSCSQNSAAMKYDFKPYRFARNVPFERVDRAFDYLANERLDTSFSATTDAIGVMRFLQYENNLPYDENETFHVSLQSTSSIARPSSETTFAGLITPSSSAEANYYLQVIIQCGFWGEADWSEALDAHTTHSADVTCSYTVTPYELVYPEVDCDRGNYEILPIDIIDFLRMSLFQYMVVPIQNAMDALGIYPAGFESHTCPATA